VLRLLRILAAALVVASVAAVTAATADTSPAPYAPLNRPGPALSVPTATLAAALHCTSGVDNSTREPILLIPGTDLDPQPNFGWNYERAFDAQHWPYCTVTLPGHTMGDAQIAGEYVVYALRRMAARSGHQVEVLGYSQGGMLPRWALRWWPDTRSLVDDVVGLDPSNHGTLDAVASCQFPCPVADRQQATGSAFLTALNSGAETFAGVDYTVVFSRTDEVVVPNLDATGSSSLHTGAGHIANIAVQDICPNDTSEHLAMGSYDAVGYALAVDAFTHTGVAAAARVPLATCTQPLQPGVDPTTFPSDYAAYLAFIGQSQSSAPTTSSEPPLKCYVYATPPRTCAGAAATTTSSASGSSNGSAEPRGPVLASTGASVWLPALGLMVLLGALGIQRQRERQHGRSAGEA
jgi:triacylglycerol esterase/lipase EstA (alpha/beta hydrolase family)